MDPPGVVSAKPATTIDALTSFPEEDRITQAKEAIPPTKTSQLPQLDPNCHQTRTIRPSIEVYGVVQAWPMVLGSTRRACTLNKVCAVAGRWRTALQFWKRLQAAALGADTTGANEGSTSHATSRSTNGEIQQNPEFLNLQIHTYIYVHIMFYTYTHASNVCIPSFTSMQVCGACSPQGSVNML